VSNLTATPGNGRVVLTWTNPSDSDLSTVIISAVPAEGDLASPHTESAAPGSAGTYPVTGLANGTPYTFTLKTEDSDGNQSSGAQVAGCPEIINAVWGRSVTAGPNVSLFESVAVSGGYVYAAGSQSGAGTFGYGNGKDATGKFGAGKNALLVRYHAGTGMAQWAKTVTKGPDHSCFNAVSVSGGYVYAAGYQSGAGYFDYGLGDITGKNNLYDPDRPKNIILIKYNATTGDPVWQRTTAASYDESNFYAMTTDTAGNVYAVGYQFGSGNYNYGTNTTQVIATGGAPKNNALIVKYDAGGVAQWAKTVTGGGDDSYFYGVAVSGNFVYAAGWQEGTGTFNYGNSKEATGVNSTSVNKENVILVQYDANTGDAQWAKTTATGPNDSYFYGVAAADNGVYAVGGQMGTGNYNYGDGTGDIAGTSSAGYNILLVKYNTGGITQWAKTVQSGGYEQSAFRKVAVDTNGNVYAAGWKGGNIVTTYGTGVTAGGISSISNTLLVKYDSSGTAQWAKTASAGTELSPPSSSLFGLALDNAGAIYAAGAQAGAETSVANYGTAANPVNVAGRYNGGNNVLVLKYRE
jgi:hypothetical protein